MNLKLPAGTNTKNYNFCKGVSLAEILFAIAILSFILVSIIGLLAGSLKVIQNAVVYKRAALIAERTVENYKAMDYSSVPIYNPPVITGENNFIIKISINEVLYPSTTIKCKKLTVNVTGAKSKKTAKEIEVTLSAYLHPY